MSFRSDDNEAYKLALVSRVVALLANMQHLRTKWVEYKHLQCFQESDGYVRRIRLQSDAFIAVVNQHEHAVVKGVRIENHEDLPALEKYIERMWKDFEAVTNQHMKRMIKAMMQEDPELTKVGVKQALNLLGENSNGPTAKTIKKWTGL